LNMDKEAASHSKGTSVADLWNFGTDPDPRLANGSGSRQWPSRHQQCFAFYFLKVN
jgi:hypothetical protein